MSDKLKCTHCGYTRLITSEWLEDLRMKYSSSTSGLAVENIETFLPRLKCSRCSAKAARIITSKTQPPSGQVKQRIFTDQGKKKKVEHTKYILGTVFSTADNQSEREKTTPTKWSKKTCPACNGDGLGGHCYRCEGTGWVEATF